MVNLPLRREAQNEKGAPRGPAQRRRGYAAHTICEWESLLDVGSGRDAGCMPPAAETPGEVALPRQDRLSDQNSG